MMNLLEWAVAYVKYKDSVAKKIQDFSVDESSRTATVANKDGSTDKYLISESLSDLDASSLQAGKVVCLNRKANVDWLAENWDAVKSKKLTFIFVNVQKAESWSLNTMVHHSITDKPALKMGLKALFESVPEVM